MGQWARCPMQASQWNIGLLFIYHIGTCLSIGHSKELAHFQLDLKLMEL